MSTGRLAAIHVNSANTDTNIYSAPTGKTGVITLSLCNLNSQTITVKIAIKSNTSAPNMSDYIEYNFELTPSNTYERTGIVLSAGQTVSVSCSNNASAVVWGYEE
jgi:hypothetical protein